MQAEPVTFGEPAKLLLCAVLQQRTTAREEAKKTFELIPPKPHGPGQIKRTRTGMDCYRRPA